MRLTRSVGVLVTAFLLGTVACSDESSEPEATTGAASPESVGGTAPEPSATTLDSTGAVPAGTVDVFSFAEDDLCDRVSEADVAEWIAAEFDWDGTAAEVATDADGSCAWMLASTDAPDGVVRASDAALWRGFDGLPFDVDEAMAEAGVTEYPPPAGYAGIGAFVVGHPAVSDGVVVFDGGFGQFAFGVPPGPWLQVSIESDRLDDDLDPHEYEARRFAVADRFLRDLGWVPDVDASEPTSLRDASVVAAPADWNPVLAAASASPAPPVVACDATTSAVDGELELPEFMRERLGTEPPYARWFAAFDPTTHSVTVIGQYGDGQPMAAGALDVCTDTWSPIAVDLRHPDPGETAVVSSLVYDVDSDAMVAYTSGGVFVYDTELDEWQHHPVPRNEAGLPEHWVVSAAYHPASGLIIAADGSELLAHDVDTDEWTRIATFPFATAGADSESDDGPVYAEFLGVIDAMDRLVFGVVGTGTGDERTWLADPASGEAMVVQTPELPHVNIVWPNEAFGSADGTVFATRQSWGELCGFDANRLTWDRCVASAAHSPTQGPGPGWAIVGDPVNNRLLAISTTTVETWPIPRW